MFHSITLSTILSLSDTSRIKFVLAA